jgi:hypothetical protein
MKQGISLPQIPKKLLDTDKELYDYLFGLQQALLAKQTDDYGAVDKTSSDLTTLSGTVTSFITDNKASQAEAIAGTLDTKIITPHTLREGFNASGDAPVFACRAWVNFNSSGTIQGQGNVESVVRNSTGDYTITFETAMPDANYAVAVTGGTIDYGYHAISLASGSVRVVAFLSDNNTYGDQNMYVAIFR